MAVDPVEGVGRQHDGERDAAAASAATPARQKWNLTQQAFDGLLAAIGPDRDAAADRYLEIRRNLVRFFEWRGCPTPDEYADETINRCARKIGEGDEIRDVPTYVVGIARMLLREVNRDRAKAARPLNEVPEPRAAALEPVIDVEPRVQCLRRCLARLSPENRDLILHYYQGDKGDKIKNRKGLLHLFEVSASTLRMRALRLREKLQSCTEECLERSGTGSNVTNLENPPVLYDR
jgi:DNA-directed RNA polymerase specialized sigma24 family protein